MPNTPQVNFTEIDNSVVPTELPVNIVGISVEMERGPIGVAEETIDTTEALRKKYGRLSLSNDHALQAQLAIEGGCRLRVNNIRHYDDITDNTSCDAVLATVNGTNGGVVTTVTGTITTGNYTLAVTGFTSAVVPFTTNALTTMQRMVLALKTLNPTKVQAVGAFVNPITGTNSFYICPKPGIAVAGVTVTGTGVSADTQVQLAEFGRVISSTMTELFTVAPKAAGLAYNRLIVGVLPPSNNTAGYFNIQETMVDEESYTTTIYPNIKIEGTLPANQLNFLDAINAVSVIATYGYLDLSAIASGTVLVPLYGFRTFSGGTDGSATDSTDYIGDAAARTGFHAFNPYDDMIAIATPNNSDDSVIAAGAEYAATRKDLIYMGHISNTLTTSDSIATKADSLALDNSYTQLTAGGLKVTHPLSGQTVDTSEVGSTLGLMARVFKKVGPWASYGGSDKGLYPKGRILGVVNNFGTPADVEALKTINSARVSMVITRNKKTQLCGCFTTQIATSLLSFMSTRNLMVFVRKTLTEILGRYVEAPNLIITWGDIADDGITFLEGLKTSGAIYNYTWEGDQLAPAMDNQYLKVNNTTDVGLGKYKIKMRIAPVPGIQEIELVAIIEGGSVTITEA